MYLRSVSLVTDLSTDPCNAGVCQNGGTCSSEVTQRVSGQEYHYTCLCPPGHMGPTCEGQSHGEGDGMGGYSTVVCIDLPLENIVFVAAFIKYILCVIEDRSSCTSDDPISRGTELN